MKTERAAEKIPARTKPSFFTAKAQSAQSKRRHSINALTRTQTGDRLANMGVIKKNKAKCPSKIHDAPRLDKSAFVVESFQTLTPDYEYWRKRPLRERFIQAEYLRQIVYGKAITTARIQRVLEVAELKPR